MKEKLIRLSMFVQLATIGTQQYSICLFQVCLPTPRDDVRSINKFFIAIFRFCAFIGVTETPLMTLWTKCRCQHVSHVTCYYPAAGHDIWQNLSDIWTTTHDVPVWSITDFPPIIIKQRSVWQLKGHGRRGDTGERRSYLDPPAVPQLPITASGNRNLVHRV